MIHSISFLMWHADVCINFFTQEKKIYETLKTKLINRQMIDSTKNVVATF